MRNSVAVRSMIGATAAAAMLLVGAVPAQAAASSQFDAPLLGTTATAQAARFPVAADLRCSDAACTAGVLRNPEGGDVEYSTTTIVRDAGYTNVPEFRRGVMASWGEVHTPANGSESVTFTIAEYETSDMLAVLKATSAKVAMTVTPTIVSGTEVWVGEVVNASESDNIYTGSSFKSAAVLGANSMVRASCAAGGASLQTSQCTTAKLAQLAVAIANRQPGLSARDAATINRLVPNNAPKGVTPLVASVVDSRDLWATDISNARLLDGISQSTSVFAQYTLAGQPQLRVRATYAGLARTSLAAGFLGRACPASSTRACTKTNLAGGLGIQVVWFDKGTATKNAALVSYGAGNGRLVRIECNQRLPLHGELSKAQRGLCAKAATQLLTAAVN